MATIRSALSGLDVAAGAGDFETMLRDTTLGSIIDLYRHAMADAFEYAFRILAESIPCNEQDRHTFFFLYIKICGIQHLAGIGEEVETFRTDIKMQGRTVCGYS